jgi:hypothetical protein
MSDKTLESILLLRTTSKDILKEENIYKHLLKKKQNPPSSSSVSDLEKDSELKLEQNDNGGERIIEEIDTTNKQTPKRKFDQITESQYQPDEEHKAYMDQIKRSPILGAKYVAQSELSANCADKESGFANKRPKMSSFEEDKNQTHIQTEDASMIKIEETNMIRLEDGSFI